MCNNNVTLCVTVVPTTTPPLVWPSNGQNKGAPTKILNPTSVEGWIKCKQDWIAPSLVFDDLRYGIEWALLMLCLRWLATGLVLSSHDVKTYMEVGCTCFWFLLMV